MKSRYNKKPEKPMRITAKIRLISFMMLLFLSGACNLIRPSSRDKAMAAERQKEKAVAKEFEAREKAHYKSQPGNTRKMMKQSRRQAEKLNRAKRRR